MVALPADGAQGARGAATGGTEQASCEMWEAAGSFLGTGSCACPALGACVGEATAGSGAATGQRAPWTSAGPPLRASSAPPALPTPPLSSRVPRRPLALSSPLLPPAPTLAPHLRLPLPGGAACWPLAAHHCPQPPALEVGRGPPLRAAALSPQCDQNCSPGVDVVTRLGTTQPLGEPRGQCWSGSHSPGLLITPAKSLAMHQRTALALGSGPAPSA